MSRLMLLGNPGTKRTRYLEKGAALWGVQLCLLDWKEFPRNLLSQDSGAGPFFLKIDPPLWDSCCLEQLSGLTWEYKENLMELARQGSRGKICFFNDPKTIKALLDKRGCKRRLREMGIPVTEELEFFDWEGGKKEGPGQYPRFSDLLDAMKDQGIFQVFLKPNYGSGAAGVMALRCDPAKGQMVLYTCAAKDPETGRLVNTKRLRRFGDRQQVSDMAQLLLRQDCIAERWYPKAEHNGHSYDLRVVVQDGEVDFALARLSKGPITNLQLNNRPLKVEELGLSDSVWDRVRQICLKAAGCYPGLRSAGIDILLEKGSLRPRVIEMNGQGDLIYQDIYGENRIYQKQGKMMREWQMRRQWEDRIWKNTC